jgi:hypothetical protein
MIPALAATLHARARRHVLRPDPVANDARRLAANAIPSSSSAARAASRFSQSHRAAAPTPLSANEVDPVVNEVAR